MIGGRVALALDRVPDLHAVADVEGVRERGGDERGKREREEGNEGDWLHRVSIVSLDPSSAVSCATVSPRAHESRIRVGPDSRSAWSVLRRPAARPRTPRARGPADVRRSRNRKFRSSKGHTRRPICVYQRMAWRKPPVGLEERPPERRGRELHEGLDRTSPTGARARAACGGSRAPGACSPSAARSVWITRRPAASRK